VSRKILSFSADNLPEPITYFWTVHSVVIHPVLVTGIVGRVNIYAFDFSGVVRKERFESKEIIALDEQVPGVGITGG
jgi:hypothetical protein